MRNLKYERKLYEIYRCLQGGLKMDKNIDKSFLNEFEHVVNLIINSHRNALQKVNEELINLYFNIGSYISEKVHNNKWGTSVVNKLADYIKEKHPEIKGFTRRGLYRMKQFYETYKDNEKVSSLLSQINWTHHLLIMSKTKTLEEKEFYMRLAIQENLSSRELERQLNTAVFERSMIANKIVPSMPADLKDNNMFRDTYIFEFLNFDKFITN